MADFEILWSKIKRLEENSSGSDGGIYIALTTSPLTVECELNDKDNAALDAAASQQTPIRLTANLGDVYVNAVCDYSKSSGIVMYSARILIFWEEVPVIQDVCLVKLEEGWLFLMYGIRGNATDNTA